MPDLIAFFGRFHPFLNHLPIGLLVGLLAIELVADPLRRVRVGKEEFDRAEAVRRAGAETLDKIDLGVHH